MTSSLQCEIIEGFRVYHRNREELEKIRWEIFEDKEYAFETDGEAPLIFDCGAHVGLAVIYFNIRYPKSRIIAFEADPENVELLKKNIEVNSLSDVTVVNAALWSSEGRADLYSEINDGDPWTWGNTVIHDIWGDADGSRKRTVRTTCLSRYIADEPIDFVKIDIEGAEEAVIREVQPQLHKIREMLIEFHGTNTSREVNDIGRISEMLERNGFEIDVIEKDLTKSFKESSIAELDPDLLLIRASNAAFNRV